MKENKIVCNCKHEEYCRIKDKENCIGRNDPWFRPDQLIMGMTSRQINALQGRDKDLNK